MQSYGDYLRQYLWEIAEWRDLSACSKEELLGLLRARGRVGMPLGLGGIDGSGGSGKGSGDVAAKRENKGKGRKESKRDEKKSDKSNSKKEDRKDGAEAVEVAATGTGWDDSGNGWGTGTTAAATNGENGGGGNDWDS